MLIILFGSRDWTDKEAIQEWAAAQDFPPDTVFMHGGNGYTASGAGLRPNHADSLAVRGADCLAGAVVGSLGFEVRRYFADWNAHGLSAGPKRNRLMADQRPDVGWCFHADVERSKGSRGMLRMLEAQGCPVTVVKG